jgi:hypothetical protein
MAEKNIDFINGVFDKTEAAEILLSVINDKIRFHNVSILGIKERSDGDSMHSEVRLEQLTKAKEEIMRMFRLECDQNSKIKIKSTISIEILD